MKSRLLDVSRTNYAPRFSRWNTKLLTCLLTRWNKVGLSFFTFSEVQAFRRRFHWSCQNRTMYATRTWTLTHWNWHGFMRCPIGFKYSTLCALNCWSTKGFSWSKNKHKQLFWSLLTTHARTWKVTYGLFSKSGVAAISLQLYLLTMHYYGPWPFFWPLKYSFSLQQYSLCW